MASWDITKLSSDVEFDVLGKNKSSNEDYGKVAISDDERGTGSGSGTHILHQFKDRNQRYTKGWTEGNGVPFWGKDFV